MRKHSVDEIMTIKDAPYNERTQTISQRFWFA